MDENELNIPEELRDEKARALYAALCEEYMRVHGVEVIPDSSLALLLDICRAEQIKAMLQEKIAKRPMDHIRNGRQEYLEAQRRHWRSQQAEQQPAPEPGGAQAHTSIPQGRDGRARQ